MKKNTKEYMEALEMMEGYFASMQELDILEFGDEKAHLHLAGALGLQMEGAGSAKHVSRLLYTLIEDPDYTTAKECAQEFVSSIPEGWSQEKLLSAINEAECLAMAMS